MIKRLFSYVWLSIMSQLGFFTKLFTKKGRRELEIDGMNEVLQEAVIEQMREKIVVRRKILSYRVKKQYKNMGSKYIPVNIVPKHKMKADIEATFKEELAASGLKVTPELDVK